MYQINARSSASATVSRAVQLSLTKIDPTDEGMGVQAGIVLHRHVGNREDVQLLLDPTASSIDREEDLEGDDTAD